ncbi:MAG: nucleotidyl transferase AbiEii/AbiGii toxin family protein [Lautropia sp.]|nr:nucleotidyl transferase AbiEii/AbiGii toxin family protein [Lautropia sp.]
MPETRPPWFSLTPTEQAEVLHAMATHLGRRAQILEKDIWLCQVLQTLFALPNRKPMAFKGGTSLSKVHQAIERFSEDIDITIDYRSLLDHEPDLASLSNTQRKKLSGQIRAALIPHIRDELLPALHTALGKNLPATDVTLELSDDAEKLRVHYPSAVDQPSPYLHSSILIEFGGRNATLPQDLITIEPDISPLVPQLSLPSAQVCVLSPLRTFWEKATLIHVECHRPALRAGADRLSRHWYDLARLTRHPIGQQALANRQLLHDVLSIKETFYRSANTHYQHCLSGQFRLIPGDTLLTALRADYQAMLDAHMFYGTTLPFDDIITTLTQLEQQLNTPV